MYSDQNEGGAEAVQLEVIGTEALSAMERASIDCQIATARRYPRDFVKVKKDMLSLATLDEETAASCFYKLNRQGKDIEGPSVRMAEIALSCFGNMRAGSRIIANDGKTITAQGVCHDLEKNVLISVEVKRRITDRSGKTYSEDMQVVTGNAACAIAIRNAAYKVVPFALIKPVYEAAKLTARGDMKTLSERRTGWLKWYAARGVNEAQVLTYLSKSGAEAIDLADIESLAGLCTAIKDGSTTVDEAFGPKVESVRKPVTNTNATGHPVTQSFSGEEKSASPAKASPTAQAAPNPTPSVPTTSGTPTATAPELQPVERATPAQGVRNLCESAKVSEAAVLEFLRQNGSEVPADAKTLESAPAADLESLIPQFLDFLAQLQGIDAELTMGSEAEGDGSAPAPEETPLEQLRTMMADAGITEAEIIAYAKENRFTTKLKPKLAELAEGRIEQMIASWSVVETRVEDMRRRPQAVGA